MTYKAYLTKVLNYKHNKQNTKHRGDRGVLAPFCSIASTDAMFGGRNFWPI